MILLLWPGRGPPTSGMSLGQSHRVSASPASACLKVSTSDVHKRHTVRQWVHRIWACKCVNVRRFLQNVSRFRIACCPFKYALCTIKGSFVMVCDFPVRPSAVILAGLSEQGDGHSDSSPQEDQHGQDGGFSHSQRHHWQTHTIPMIGFHFTVFSNSLVLNDLTPTKITLWLSSLPK